MCQVHTGVKARSMKFAWLKVQKPNGMNLMSQVKTLKYFNELGTEVLKLEELQKNTRTRLLS